MEIKHDYLPNPMSVFPLFRYDTIVYVHIFNIQYHIFAVNLVISWSISIGKALGNAETTENHRSPLSRTVGHQLEFRFIMKTSSHTMQTILHEDGILDEKLLKFAVEIQQEQPMMHIEHICPVLLPPLYLQHQSICLLLQFAVVTT